jgi:hypothetical protein
MRGKASSVSTQELRGHSSPSMVPMCPGCRKPMVFKRKKPIMFTNGRAEATYRCDTCEIETKRKVKVP